MTIMNIHMLKENLENSEATLKRKRDELRQVQYDYTMMRKRVKFFKLQVDTAVKEGKTHFDPEKYLVKRKVK